MRIWEVQNGGKIENNGITKKNKNKNIIEGDWRINEQCRIGEGHTSAHIV